MRKGGITADQKACLTMHFTAPIDWSPVKATVNHTQESELLNALSKIDVRNDSSTNKQT
jgi:hypothetical protein